METETEERPFICGVVEGFYNRPWNQGQRVDLYQKLNTFGLNAYLYAPKDDVKHRALWRDPYDESELQQLKILIDGCRENDVTFYYGISPGLDIGYSNPKDIGHLKAKLDQMVRIGCKGFAVLWDDIGTNLPSADKEAFNTLADAQVKVCNEIYEHLKRPAFLTCPVEYCATRADPSVLTSPYLNSLGTGLDPNIDIFWTGSQVVSEHIYKEEIIELSKVLKRKPLIWDNLHANDYDIQRVFLGPYTVRSPDIIPYLKGVFTNPNCEYSLNIPALFTLAAWSHCYDPRTGNISTWNPAVATDLAISHFLEECHRQTTVSTFGSMSQAQVLKAYSSTPGAAFKQAENWDSSHSLPNLQAKEHSTSANSSSGAFPSGTLDKHDIELLFHLYWLPHSNGPKAETLVKDFRQLRDYLHIIQKLGLQKSNLDDDDQIDKDNDTVSNCGTMSSDESTRVGTNGSVDISEVEASLEVAAKKGERDLVSTWQRKASEFNEVCKHFERIMVKMSHIENREMFFDLDGYLMNLNAILQSCNRYLKLAGVERTYGCYGGPTLAGLPGGVAGDLLRLYPAQSNDEYPIVGIRTPKSDDPVYRPLPKKSWSILGPAFSRLLCESHGVPESEVPEEVIKLIQSYKIGAFLAEEDAVPLVVETSSTILPAAQTLILPGISGAAIVETFKTESQSIASTLLASNLFEMSEGEKNAGSNNVIAALVGTRSVPKVIKRLQEQFDTAKALDYTNLPIALPSDGGLPWHALSSFDYLMTFAATPRILFTKLLADMFKKFFEITINPQQNSSSNDSSGGAAPEAPVKCKYGILMEKTSAISIQFLYDQGFRKVENFSNFVVMELEMETTNPS